MTACFLHLLLPAPVVALVKYVNSINTTTSLKVSDMRGEELKEKAE